MQVCGICFEPGNKERPLFVPCNCRRVHRDCLDNWRTSEVGRAFAHACEMCHVQYITSWRPMTTAENVVWSIDTAFDLSILLLPGVGCALFVVACYELVNSGFRTTDDVPWWLYYVIVTLMFAAFFAIACVTTGAVMVLMVTFRNLVKRNLRCMLKVKQPELEDFGEIGARRKHCTV